jgi:hypothetical protein
VDEMDEQIVDVDAGGAETDVVQSGVMVDGGADESDRGTFEGLVRLVDVEYLNTCQVTPTDPVEVFRLMDFHTHDMELHLGDPLGSVGAFLISLHDNGFAGSTIRSHLARLRRWGRARWEREVTQDHPDLASLLAMWDREG